MNIIEWHQPFGQTCRIVTKSGKTYGLFYDTNSSLRHIAEFKPYIDPPHVTLCGNKYVNFSGTGMINDICPSCEDKLKEIIKEFGIASGYHKHWFKSILNPIITKFGWILVSCFDNDKFIGFKLKTYPEHCHGKFKTWYRIRF